MAHSWDYYDEYDLQTKRVHESQVVAMVEILNRMIYNYDYDLHS